VDGQGVVVLTFDDVTHQERAALDVDHLDIEQLIAERISKQEATRAERGEEQDADCAVEHRHAEAGENVGDAEGKIRASRVGSVGEVALRGCEASFHGMLPKQSGGLLVRGDTIHSSYAMLHRLRSYRFLAVLLVGTLMLGSSMALVRHACAMSMENSAHTVPMHGDATCCCDEMPSHEAPVPTGDAPAEEAPCHDGPAPATTSEATPHHSASPCCVIEQPTSTLDDVVLTEAPSTVLLLTALAAVSSDKLLLPDSDPLASSEAVSDAVGPPHRLHLIHATFLN
jgi:hypothetical protein